MIHVTLNTGNTQMLDPAEITEDNLKPILTIVRKGGGTVVTPYGSHRIDINMCVGTATFTLWSDKQPLLTSTMAWQEDIEEFIWEETERSYYNYSDKYPQLMAPGAAAERPESSPWVASILWPSFNPSQQAPWVGKLETYVAWAILFESDYFLYA